MQKKILTLVAFCFLAFRRAESSEGEKDENIKKIYLERKVFESQMIFYLFIKINYRQ